MPPLVSGGWLPVILTGVAVTWPLPVPTVSSVAAGTEVVWLTTADSAVPVGPFEDPDPELPEPFDLMMTNATTTMITARMDPPAR